MTTSNSSKQIPQDRLFSTGKLPSGCSYILRLINKLRRQLETEVTEARGSINTADAAAINTMCRWEMRAMVSQRLMREPAVTVKQQAALLRDITSSTERRDAAYKRLGIDTSSEPQLQTMSQQDRFMGIMDDIQATQGRHPCNVETD